MRPANNNHLSKQGTDKHIEVDSVEKKVLKQPSSAEQSLWKQCNESTDVKDLSISGGSHQILSKALPAISITPRSLPKTKNQNSKYFEDQIEQTNKSDKKQNHLSYPSSKEGFQCNHCRKIFQTKTRLKKHKRCSIVCSSK
uniref:C2H2-type domain-containing protein n=1 Tax=Bactrocera latifrons TaxID=174628 RepID=A0A0K8UGF2_BACLA